MVAGPELDALAAHPVDEPFPLDGPGGGTMLYTSGTTGRPKGVKRRRQPSLQETLALGGAAGMLLGLDGKGPHLVTGPLYHAAPLGFAAIDLANGSELVVMPRWDESQCLRLIQERAVRNSHVVPTMCVRLLRVPEEERAAFDPSSLQHGAARRRADRAVHQAPDDRVVGARCSRSTGGAPRAACSPWSTRRRGSPSPAPSARRSPPTRCSRSMPTASGCRPGEVGTLYTHNLVTDEVFEYHQAEEKTAAAHLAPGTFTMGDVGHVDEDGYVFLSDRAANMIISGGVNIYPAEIEQVLIDHPAVADVAVFGIPDDEWGEQVKAAVELQDGYEPSRGARGRPPALRA